MKKKIGTLLAISALCGIMLVGCGHKHEWKDATCTSTKTCTACGETEGESLGHTWIDANCVSPKTCSVCGATEGAALGHSWVDANCVNPKTCSVCGATEGEALGHTFTEANYQQPATCTVCGATEGDVLTPAFVEHEVKGQFMELDKTYDYYTQCYNDNSFYTTAKATVSDYRTFLSDDTHEAKEGYEWKTVTVTVVFSDENANDYGFMVRNCREDYYDIVGNDNSTVNYDDGTSSFTVNWNGQDYTECIQYSKRGHNGWVGNVSTWTWEYACLVPEGYDGRIIGLRNAANEWLDGMYIFDVADENTLFFRLK